MPGVRRCSGVDGGERAPHEAVLRFSSKRDKYVKVVSSDAGVRASFAQMPHAVLEVLSRHGIAHDTADAKTLAEVLLCTSLMASFQGGEERVHLEYEANGIIVSGEATATGEIRGSIKDSYSTVSNGVKVSKVLYNQKHPALSVTPASSGKVIPDAREHILRSDGLEAALFTEVNLARKVCTGMLLQQIPTTAEASPHNPDVFRRIERDLESCAFNDSGDIGHAGVLMKRVFQGDLAPVLQKSKLVFVRKGGVVGEECGVGSWTLDNDLTQTVPVDFLCRCSLDKFVAGLTVMGTAKLSSLRFEQPECPLRCETCGTTYAMTPDAWEKAQELTEKSEAGGEGEGEGEGSRS